MNHFAGLTPAEYERLAVIAEEAAEVVQIAMKIMRHGYESCHPNDLDTTNRQLLEMEIGHLSGVCRMAIDAGDISEVEIGINANDKQESVKKYLHHYEP